jgi:hypothetical protein
VVGIVTAILGIVLSVLYMTFYQSMAALAHTEDRSEVIQQGRLILERMTMKLRLFLPFAGVLVCVSEEQRSQIQQLRENLKAELLKCATC